MFDDAIDESHFEIEDANIVTPEEIETESLIGEESEESSNTEEDDTPTVTDFDDIDLGVLDSEFSLELLFEEDSTEQVVSEIEELIAEDESDVPDASIPDNESKPD